MIFTLVIAVALMFFVLGHATLLYFLIEDHKVMNVAAARIILPLPARGKFVGLLCLLLAAVFCLLGIFTYPTLDQDPRPIPFALIFVASVPLAVHAGYVISRIKRHDAPPRKLVFVATHVSP